MFGILKKKNAGESVTLQIKGMHCTSCAMNIDGELEDTDGVTSAETSYAKGAVTINYEAEKITLDQLIQIIEKQGYKVAA